MEQKSCCPPNAAAEAADPELLQRFVPGREPAIATVVMLSMIAAVEALSVVGALCLRAWPAEEGAIAGVGAALAVLKTIGGMARLGSAVVFCRWFYRAYRNLGALGVTRDYEAAWAPISFLIPLFNLVRPYHIAKEIWVGSDVDGSQPGCGAVSLWWALFLASCAATCAVACPTDDLQTLSVLSVVASSLWVGAALACIRMIRGIEAMQERASCWVAGTFPSAAPALVSAL